MSSETRIGVIGAGGRGHLAWYAHKPEEGVRLVAAMDVKDEPLDEFRKEFGPEVFTTNSLQALLDRDDIDAVFVTSPDRFHEEQAVAALEAGKAVFLDKPMAITLEGCDRILETAYRQRVKLYLGHNMRHAPYLIKLKQVVDSGAIGEVMAGWCRHFIAYGGDAFFKDWHADRRNTTSLLLQKGAHDIDALHWLCGGYTTRVTAMGGLTLYNRITDRHDPSERGDARFCSDNWPPLTQKQLNPVLDVEDLSMMLMHLDNGVFCSYQQCHYTPDAWRNYTIIGTEGRVENFSDSPGSCVVRLYNRRGAYNPYGDEQYYIPPPRGGQGGHGGADPAVVAEFIRFIREGGVIQTSPVAGRNSVAAGYMATHSLRNGAIPMDIPAVAPEVLAYFDANQPS